MAQPPNYRHMKKRREEEQRREQAQKQARRGRVPAQEPGAPAETPRPPTK